MYSADIALMDWIREIQLRDLLTHAERQRAAALALEARAHMRRPLIDAARAAVAAALLRAGSGMSQEPAPDRCASPG